jgi:hypothetical protein
MVNYGRIGVIGSSAYILNWTFDNKKGLEVFKTQGLITNSCNYFYKLQALYTQNTYNENNIWKYVIKNEGFG